jgi:hypothetical protein
MTMNATTASSSIPTIALTGAAPDGVQRPSKVNPLMNRTEPAKNRPREVVRCAPLERGSERIV